MAIEHILEVARLANAAEEKVQQIMLDLNEELIDYGVKVETIDVDTRRFAGLRVNITVGAR